MKRLSSLLVPLGVLLNVLLSVALLTPGTLAAQTVDVAPASPVSRLLQSMVFSDASAERAQIRNFYGPSGYRLVWTRGGRPTAQALKVISLFEGAEAKGLSAAQYDAGQWTARLSDLTGDGAQARFELAMTETLIRYTNDLRVGRVRYSADPSLDFSSLVQSAATGDPAVAIAAAEPQDPEYDRLLNALASYRRMAASDEAPLPAVMRLAAGGSWDALPQLAAKLRLYGDLPAEARVEGTKYEGAIVDAVKHFQARHGLDADGIIAKATLAQLNVTASQRVKQLEVAIERVRATAPAAGGPSIIVNIPEFKLRAYSENGEEDALTMRVVVGKASSSRTPVFDGDLKHVVFRPYWNVPPSIQRGEIAPKFSAAYAAQHNYEVLDGAGRVVPVTDEAMSKVRSGAWRVRQKPGTSNALGLVKFLFPNDNNVYLHDTPQQSAFARARRDFSHGCVRLQDPAALAEWVLRQKKDWDRAKVDAALQGTRDDLYVKLEKPVTVKLVYHTASARPDGRVYFFEDIYGHDATLVAQLTPSTPKGGGAVLLAAKR